MAVGATSVQSAALSNKSDAVRLISTTACRVAFGAPGYLPTATATSLYLAPNVAEVFAVNPSCVVAVLQESAAGKLSITEVTS